MAKEPLLIDDALKAIDKILHVGTGADRQLAVFEKTQSLHHVVDYIVEETLRDC